MQKRVKRKDVRYKRPEVAGIFYHENMTYYHNANSLVGKVILMYPIQTLQEKRRIKS